MRTPNESLITARQGWRALLPLLSLLLVAWGCSQQGDVTVAPGGQEQAAHDDVIEAPPAPPDACPARQHIDALPGIEAEHLSLAYWLERLGAEHDLDAPLLAVDEVATLDAAVGTSPVRGAPLDAAAEAALLRGVNERLDYMRARLEAAEYVDVNAQPLAPDEIARFASVPRIPGLAPRLYVALDTIPLRCGPREAGLYKPEVDLAFDRNNCSAAQAQEPVEVLAEWPGGMRLARTRYSLGWITPDAPLSPPVPAALVDAVVDAPRWRATRDLILQAEGRDERLEVAAGTLLAPAPSVAGARDTRVTFGAEGGVHTSTALTDGALAPTRRALTRRAVLEEAFSHLGEPYGWGGYKGARDCSRFLLDIFAAFDLHLPRFSGHQAEAGTFTIDLSEVESERDRQLLIDAAADKGVVFLYLPGHIMLYLGRDAQGVPMAIHSFAEFLAPCDPSEPTQNEAGETLFRIDRVTVSDLDIGRGSSRTAFIQRLTKLVVIGEPPGVELQGVATRRAPAPLEAPPERCEAGADGVGLLVSPEAPHEGATLRAIATSTADPGAATLTLFGPDGQRHAPPLRRLGGPPYSLVADVEAPARGAWTVVFGEAGQALACARVQVHGRPRPRGAERAVWTPTRAWNQTHENLYAAFVESLFDYPLEEDPTWTNLHTLLDDPTRNLLHGHLGHGEEGGLRLTPDCADLPYVLRAYFAWKLRLPFAFRRCNRGRRGRAPTCGEPESNLMPAQGNDPVRAFNRFAQGTVRNTVHSGCGRTAPRDSQTDYYPVPLNREALRPGTLYADPYGHLLVVARWIPQGVDQYGVLIAADAQPDGTVGLKRFWRGTFLFIPDIEVAGAGFKAFRPVVYRDGAVEALPNEAIGDSDAYVPYSEQQYAGTSDDFYVAMEALINPRPLDPFAMQRWLIDALEEAIAFRLISVDNGVRYLAAHPGTIDMPEGAAIFQTTGAWEDFSTPSRDMRILIALDTVVRFPDVVRQHPQRFGLDPTAPDLDAQLSALDDYLARELAARTFSYTRSDGQPQTLSLADVVARQRDLEMAYNPNDCIEVRWGAPEDSDERASCARRAPEAQRRRMLEHRPWFSSRQRPLD